MQVVGVDERCLIRERTGTNFVVFIYEGGDAPHTSWSIDSYLLTDAEVTQVLRWLADNLPENTCWSLGVVLAPAVPSASSDLDVAWIVGMDILNSDPNGWSAQERQLAHEMLTRRHRTALP